MIEYLVKINEQLMSAPAGVVIILFAISLGYVLKKAEFFANRFIPFVVVCFTACAFPIVQLCSDEIANVPKLGWHIPLNMLLGFVLGAFAWFFHAQILKRWVDPKYFPDGQGARASNNPPPEAREDSRPTLAAQPQTTEPQT